LANIWNAVDLCWHYGLQRIKMDMAYRGDFLINTGINLLYSVVQIFFIWALFSRVPEIAGWSFEEVVLIYGFGQLTFGYFSIGFFNMAVGFSDHYIIEGNLDRPLVRPLPALLQVMMENINLRDATIIVKATVIIWWALKNVEPAIPITIPVMLMVQALGLLGGLVYSGVFLTVVSWSFWVKDRVGFASPLFSISEASRYPITIYARPVQIFFSIVIPFGYCAFFPSVYFVDPVGWLPWLLAGPLIAAVTLCVGVFTFNRGVRAYESTGS